MGSPGGPNPADASVQSHLWGYPVDSVAAKGNYPIAPAPPGFPIFKDHICTTSVPCVTTVLFITAGHLFLCFHF